MGSTVFFLMGTFAFTVALDAIGHYPHGNLAHKAHCPHKRHPRNNKTTIETERRKMEDTLRSRERICREPTRCRKGNEPKRRRTNNLLERDALFILVHHEPRILTSAADFREYRA